MYKVMPTKTSILFPFSALHLAHKGAVHSQHQEGFGPESVSLAAPLAGGPELRPDRGSIVAVRKPSVSRGCNLNTLREVEATGVFLHETL